VDAYFHLSTQNEKTKAQIEALHAELKVYCYENNQEFCPLNEVDGKIKKGLSIVLQKHNILGCDNEALTQLLYEVLEKKISDKVIYIHSLNHKADTPIRTAAYEHPILLKDFMDSLRQDVSTIVQNEEYFERKIRNDINRYYQEFCIESDGEIWTDDSKAKMDKYLYRFNNLDSNNFKSFLQSIRPHKEVNYKSLEGYKDTSLDQDEIRDAFLVILREIKDSNSSEGIGWNCRESKQYYPTGIKDSNSEQSKRRVSERILRTALSINVDVPFNANYLITSECNVESIESQANDIGKVEDEQSEIGFRHEDKIVSWRRIGLIDLQTAKLKLND
jgi:hypothetical protein